LAQAAQLLLVLPVLPFELEFLEIQLHLLVPVAQLVLFHQ
jgi:hypothetical protein